MIREFVVAIFSTLFLYIAYLSASPVVNNYLSALILTAGINPAAQATFLIVQRFFNLAYIVFSIAIIVFLVASTQRTAPAENRGI